MKEDLLKIINHYGINKQLKYIHSEYFELDEAIMIYKDDFYYMQEENILEYDRRHIAEEIADVAVMLKQFQYYYNIEDKQIEDIMNYKIKRQLERIKSEDKEEQV